MDGLMRARSGVAGHLDSRRAFASSNDPDTSASWLMDNLNKVAGARVFEWHCTMLSLSRREMERDASRRDPSINPSDPIRLTGHEPRLAPSTKHALLSVHLRVFALVRRIDLGGLGHRRKTEACKSRCVRRRGGRRTVQELFAMIRMQREI